MKNIKKNFCRVNEGISFVRISIFKHSVTEKESSYLKIVTCKTVNTYAYEFSTKLLWIVPNFKSNVVHFNMNTTNCLIDVLTMLTFVRHLWSYSLDVIFQVAFKSKFFTVYNVFKQAELFRGTTETSLKIQAILCNIWLIAVRKQPLSCLAFIDNTNIVSKRKFVLFH